MTSAALRIALAPATRSHSARLPRRVRVAAVARAARAALARDTVMVTASTTVMPSQNVEVSVWS